MPARPIPMSPSSWATAICCRLARAEADGSGMAVDGWAARALIGTPIETVGAATRAVAIRPDDLQPSTDGPIAAEVEIAEYRGRDFYGRRPRMRRRHRLFFRSRAAV